VRIITPPALRHLHSALHVSVYTKLLVSLASCRILSRGSL